MLFIPSFFYCMYCTSQFNSYIIYFLIAHMWYGGKVYEAKTDEDPRDPQRTRRVSKKGENSELGM